MWVLEGGNLDSGVSGKISAQLHTIVKQICFPNGNVLFLSLFSLTKNWMHNVVWGCAEILPRIVLLTHSSYEDTLQSTSDVPTRSSLPSFLQF